MKPVHAVFDGGPLDGTARIVEGMRPFRVLRPDPIIWAGPDVGPEAAMMPVTGEYTPTGRMVMNPDVVLFSWRGWSDGLTEAPRPHRWHYTPSPALRPRDDEPGPDAMRWSPQLAEEEMAAWDALLHPVPGVPAGADTEHGQR